MADPLTFTEIEGTVFHHLKAQQQRNGNVDLEIRQGAFLGTIRFRKSQVVSAACGNVAGNGALLTLAAVRNAAIAAKPAMETVEGNVSLSLSLVERLLERAAPPADLAALARVEAGVEEAVHLLHQFKRNEAAAKLVEALRINRYYYPAWLWHSRLLTRSDFLRKALAEARKWGNVDPLVLREAAKIAPQLGEAPETVKRCIFCWSVLSAGDLRCRTCQGLLRLGEAGTLGLDSHSQELRASLELYEREFRLHPENGRIPYCLCLGQLSLGHIDQARQWIDRALGINPREPVFLKAKALLGQAPAVVAKVVVPQPPPPMPSPTGGKTILVVEDSQTSRKVISMLLVRRGYTIIEARSGSEALEQLEGCLPDLVLLDVMLPDMSGYEVLTRLRQNPASAEVVVVMLTGKNKPSDRLKGLFHGTNEYLTKPFDPAKLMAVLDKYLSGDAPVTKASPAPASPPPPPAAPPLKPAPQPAALHSQPARSESTPTQVATPPLQEIRPVAAPPPTPPMSRSEVGAAKTIMVVEDSPTSRKVVTMVLGKGGYTIEEAPTGGAALRRMASLVPDLILLDAMLPDMTGYEVLAHLKHDIRLRQVPVVMLTAKNNPVDRQKGLKSGLVAYLTKPFDPEKLLAVINEHI